MDPSTPGDWHRQYVARREQARGKTWSLFADDPRLGQYRFAALVTNLVMSLFRQAVLKASIVQNRGKDLQHTLKTLRYKLFAKAGYLTTEGCSRILKLAVAMRSRQWMEGLWDRSKSFSLPVTFTPAFSS